MGLSAAPAVGPQSAIRYHSPMRAARLSRIDHFQNGPLLNSCWDATGISPTLAGYLSDQFGSQAAFFGLAGIAACGLAAVAAIMPETRPPPAGVSSR